MRFNFITIYRTPIISRSIGKKERKWFVKIKRKVVGKRWWCFRGVLPFPFPWWWVFCSCSFPPKKTKGPMPSKEKVLSCLLIIISCFVFSSNHLGLTLCGFEVHVMWSSSFSDVDLVRNWWIEAYEWKGRLWMKWCTVRKVSTR